MKISCIQMNMRLEEHEWNFARAEELVRRTVETEKCDVVVLPENWNVGFFPLDLSTCADEEGQRTKEVFGALAKELHVNIVAGSVANKREDGFYNTAFVFDRNGTCIASYDKIHAFTPAREHEVFRQGDHTCLFELDGYRCGIIICYDIRFPELTRTLTVQGVDLLFVVSQWPDKRIPHLQVLAHARAIENQMFVAVCNSCGRAGRTLYGGHSMIIDPWGETLAQAGPDEEVISAEADFSIIEGIRNSINVFRDRRPDMYKIN